MTKQTESRNQLIKAIYDLHACEAAWIETCQVKEVFQGEIAWEGIVNVFEIKNHPKATKAYAWSSPIEGGTKRRYYAVLNIPPIDSPEKAVRASIVQDFKTGRIK